ncbi:hypothetical protein CROQUDRAFT_669729 [Cronartium quercuum f. sp. fusiforme G11]|uniref:Phosducin domain-containing protein n=1 Tax=Cronartium quercuum f. sp. fusiforme G11 TaxID=708437 RepID=A0A9P6TEE9_9BASI|nr:hypothetical protein CROQUDRAFT_669729 [Cronartium quercuum f. sp. fusiforme G11]
MSTLEQAALSGALTTVNLGDSPDPDGREPQREDEDDVVEEVMPEDEEYAFTDKPSYGTSAMSRGWSGNTGPKGVLLDFKASHGKSGAILGGADLRNGSGLSSRRALDHKKAAGSLSETDSESDKDIRPTPTTSSLYTSGRRTHRIIDRRAGGFSISHQPRKSSGSPPSTSPMISSPSYKHSKLDSRDKKLFGHLREVGVDNFIQAVEAEKDDKETTVLVHLYDPALDSCTVLNSHLSSLARLYPRTKFLRALASELDFFNSSPSSPNSHQRDFSFPSLSPSASPRSSYETDKQLLVDISPVRVEPEERRSRKPTDSDILPTLLWYRAGEYVQSLPALERELPGGEIRRGEKGCMELQSLLTKYGIIR